MGVLTNLLKLLKPGENDYYNQQTEQADNWQKVDDYAVLTNADKNGIWGGEYGGKIQDLIPKEVGKRYIDNINGKAFICIKSGDSSVVSNTIEYFTPCNVVDNLDKLQNLDKINENFLLGEFLIRDNLQGNLNIPLLDKITNYRFYAIAVTDSTDIVAGVFIFNSVTLRGIRHRFLSDSIGDIILTSNKYYDFDSAYFNSDTNFTFNVYRIGNPNYAVDSNNKIKIFGIGKIQ